MAEGHFVVDQYNVIVVRSALTPPSGGGHPLRSQYESVSELHGFLRAVTNTLGGSKRLLSKLVDADVAKDAATRDYEVLSRNNCMAHPLRAQRR